MKKLSKKFLVILSLLFIIILVLVKLNKTIPFDTIIYNFIISFKSNNLTNFLILITNLGDTIAIITILILSFIFFKNKLYPKLMTLNITCVVIINQVLKHLIRRPRPNVVHLVEESGFSFPSGHSMASLAFYGLLIYFIYKSNLNKKIKNLLIILLSILIILIGLSRIYLGVHYATDIISGFLLSTIFLIVFTHFTKKY